MSLKIKYQDYSGGGHAVSQIIGAQSKKRLITTTGRHKVNTLNELHKRGL